MQIEVWAQTHAVELEATGDVWIREISPDTIWESDLESVWSSFSSDGARRYGLIEFYVSSLTGKTLASASLSLSMHIGGSHISYPIKQKAYVIDCSGGTELTSLTWNLYHSEYDSGKQELEGFGVYDLPAGGGGEYFASIASPSDLTLIENAANSGDKKLSIVMIPVEDGTDYRCDWDDNRGNAPLLNVDFQTLQAYDPLPSYDAVDVGLNVTLTWKPGLDAISHNIYFGSDYNEVNNTTDPNTTPGRGNQLLGNEIYVPSSPLAYETTYFWRIDEVSNSGTTKGNIWQFTTMAESVLPIHCPEGDWNGDCQVNMVDLWWLTGLWLQGTNLTDFALMAEHWQEKIGPLIISEFMASNGDTFATTVGGQEEYPDWIELYNPTGVAIDLDGWYLTDNASNLTKWQFPSGYVLNPDSYLVVFASSKTGYPYVDDSGYLHTNFSLQMDSEYLALVDPDGTTVVQEYYKYHDEADDEYGYPPQERDISYGLYNGQKRYFGIPTPRQFNNGSFIDFVDDTKFSHNRGFYEDSFEVSIVCDTPGVMIRYTLDNSTPTETYGLNYTGPIAITKDPTWKPATCLRAAAFKPGWQSSDVDTHTYIFTDDVIEQPSSPSGFPSVWGDLYCDNCQGADYEMDPTIVNDPVNDPTIKDDLKAIPMMSIVMDHDDLFGYDDGIYTNSSQYDLQRASSLELFYPDSSADGFQINCSMSLYGYGSRVTEKKAFRARFKGDYGPSKLVYDLFPNSDVNTFDVLNIRSGDDNWLWSYIGNKAKYVADQWHRDSEIAMCKDVPDGIFVHLYINGLYWGIYNVFERPDASYMAEHYGGDKEEYDAVKCRYNTQLVDGDMVAWNTTNSKANAGLSSPSSYDDFQQWCDVQDLADFFILNFYSGNEDWAGAGDKNWRACRRRATGAQWKFFSWDCDTSFASGWRNSGNIYHDNVSGMSNTDGTVTRFFWALRNNQEFLMLFADRAHKHLFNGGVLTQESVDQRWMARVNEIDEAIVPESARWGDATGTLYNREDWLSFLNWLRTEWFPNRPEILIGQFRSNNLYPDIDAPVFNIDGSYQHGGEVPAGAELTMTTPGGGSPPAGVTFYYTLDGNDPREPGGAVAAGALTYAGPISLSETKLVKSRAQDDSTSEWSALNEAVFSVGALIKNLRITEIMYHPPEEPISEPNAEYIELQNVGPVKLNLNLVQFTEGIHFTFPDLDIPPGDFVIVGKDPAAIQTRYPGFSGTFAGTYTGSLANNGEQIKLEDALGRTILDFAYEDDWREITDGGGYSLTIIDPNCPDPNAWNDKDSWRASVYWGGSPGQEDSGILPNPGDLVINELLAHAPSPAYNWIELHNTTSAAINLDGWYLSDSNIDEPNLMKYRIQGVNIPANGFKVFREDLHFNNPGDPGSQVPFVLSSNGGKICLSSPLDSNFCLTGFRTTEDYGASDPNVAFGRYQKSTGTYNFVAMSVNTEDSANIHPPKVGPIVIREIMYHPDWPTGSPYDNDEYEYIELHNISASPVTLYDVNEGAAWKFTDGIEFTFPSDSPVTLGAGEYLLVVKNLTAFNWRYTVPGSVEVLEWEDGSLNNGGEKLELSRPGELGLHTRYYIRVDRVVYSDGSHPEGEDSWQPTRDADGLGSSLHRKVLTEYGNDPINWQAGIPAPEN